MFARQRSRYRSTIDAATSRRLCRRDSIGTVASAEREAVLRGLLLLLLDGKRQVAKLETAELFIGDRACFCIPHRYLQSFYGQIGFVVIDENEAPAFLQARCAKYRDAYGLDVIIMCRPSGGYGG